MLLVVRLILEEKICDDDDECCQKESQKQKDAWAYESFTENAFWRIVSLFRKISNPISFTGHIGNYENTDRANDADRSLGFFMLCS